MYENHPPLYLRPSCVGRLSPPSPRPPNHLPSRFPIPLNLLRKKLQWSVYPELPTSSFLLSLNNKQKDLEPPDKLPPKACSHHTLFLFWQTPKLSLTKAKSVGLSNSRCPCLPNAPPTVDSPLYPLKSGPLENKPLKAPCTTLLPSTTPTSQALTSSTFPFSRSRTLPHNMARSARSSYRLPGTSRHCQLAAQRSSSHL